MMRIDVLFNEGIISLEDVVKLGRKNIRKVNMENIDVVKELVGEEKTEIIVKKINEMSQETKAMSEEEKYAMELLESLEREPVEIFKDENGYVIGHKYATNRKIGEFTYKDVHVRLSTREGSEYFGSLWYEDEEGGKRQLKFEVSNGKIIFNYRITRTYYRDLLNLTERFVKYFEEYMHGEEVADINMEAIDNAIEEIFG